MTVIIKLGGSLLSKGRELVQLLREYADRTASQLVIVPGGGPFADLIKTIASQLGVSDDAAHWMAVLAMHQYGLFLADGDPVVPTIENLEEVPAAGPLCILLPFKILKADDTLPHSWDVTADTIAAFIAANLGERSFIKLTDVDGMLDENGVVIEQIRPHELIAQGYRGCIDAALPRFLVQHNMSCVIVNGTTPERIIDVIEGRATISTRIE
jgi:aspartokinase-like uncharacterized kinase